MAKRTITGELRRERRGTELALLRGMKNVLSVSVMGILLVLIGLLTGLLQRLDYGLLALIVLSLPFLFYPHGTAYFRVFVGALVGALAGYMTPIVLLWISPDPRADTGPVLLAFILLPLGAVVGAFVSVFIELVAVFMEIVRGATKAKG